MSLPERFFRQAASSSNRPALLHKSHEDGVWKRSAYAELAASVRTLAAYLVSSGLRRGDRVALLSENRPEWVLSDLAILSAGGITVPLYFTNTSAQVDHILKDSGAGIMILSTGEQLSKVLAAESSKKLDRIIVMDGAEAAAAAKTVSLEGILEKPPDKESLGEVEKRIGSTKDEETASIIYTSGTTGPPKGVMLSHGNFLFNAVACKEAVDIGEKDVFLSFLPLSHAFERTVGYYTAVLAGAAIAYAESIENIPLNMREVQPTIMLGVPRFYEKTHAAVIGKVAASPGWKQRIFDWALKTGREMVDHLAGWGAPPVGLRFRHLLADRLVFGRIRHGMGGRLRFFVSGGAPLSGEIAAFFSALGITILEGYGLTETSPVIACNTLARRRAGTVGRALPGVEVRIAGDGEIITRGPHVMQGYYNRPKETEETIRDGWLYTGDVGRLDGEGYLSITDRKKEIIVTSNGKNVAPQMIETALAADPLIRQSMVYGEGKKFITALIVPDLSRLGELLSLEDFATDPSPNLLQSERVIDLFRSRIEERQKGFAPFERIKKFLLLAEEFSMAKGEVTPTLKLNRKKIIEHYGAMLERLYDE